MSSTRASTPASDAASPMQLTPRSKVKAMLAAMDNDSDEDNAVAFPKPKATSPSKILHDSTRHSPIVDANHDGSDGEEESEEEIIRPRGRMAARMHAAGQDEEENEPEDARARVRKMLASKPKETKEPGPDTEIQNASSEDEDLPIAPRKHQARKSRTQTPQPNHSTRNSESPGGLFVSRGSEKRSRANSPASESDDDLPTNLGTNSKFQELVRKKREERQAREAELAKEKAEKARKMKNFSDMIDRDDELDEGDSEIENRLTQPTKSTRKASKKALEEMKRETQRMSRNMQLAHEARTKKKITKADLFARFKFRQPDAGDETGTRPTSSSSAIQSDPDARETTPPTSPTLNTNKASERLQTTLDQSEPAHGQEEDDDLPSLEEVLAEAPLKMDKGKGKAVEDIPSSPPTLALPKETGPLLAQNKYQKPSVPKDDSDSDLEITYSAPRNKNRKKKIDEIFDRVPARQAQESHSLQTLRLLAHLSSPGKTKKGSKASMTNPELQMSLQQRIRQQAARERAEREQSLRDRGIVVLTAEEREKEMFDVEDLIAKARREEVELTKKEKDEARQKRRENGEVDPLGESSDDEDWQDEKEVADEELSGSESENQLEVDDGDASGEDEIDEDPMSEDGEENDGEANGAAALFDNEASETESEQETGLPAEDDINQASNMDEDDELMPSVPARRRNKNLNILSDDEDESISPQVNQTPAAKHLASPMPPKTISPAAPMSVLRSATKTFIPGLTVAGPAGLGLTQIFQGTMDDSQPELHSDTTVVPETSSGGKEQDSMAFLRQMPPSFPAFEATAQEEPGDIIMDSQPGVSQVPASQPPDEISQPIQLDFSQSQIHGFDSLVEDPFSTQYSDFPSQTQDVGFKTQSPILNRFASQSQVPQSTIDTVIINPASTDMVEQENSPTVKRVGRLRRRNHTPSPEPEDERGAARDMDNEEGFDISANAFDVMRKAAKKKKPVVDDFDKKKSKAREMVNEQAEESEDEYAGLGGASDDESGGEEDALVTAMIDDEAGKEADERQLAAFYADKERAQDTKAVEKLYKDITNGMLRRKRGGDFSLSDSEDDSTARRNQKRREFARMRKALLEDERIGKIAQNPKQSAFLAAIEDRERDDEIDFLGNYEDSQEVFDSQDTEMGMEEGVQVPGTQPDTSMGPPKRKRSDDEGNSDIENRPPPHLRRTKNGAKRPSNLAEIRESLSSLIEDPNSILETQDSDSDLEIVDNEDEDDDREKSNSFIARRNRDIQVVDRISLKRSSSSNISASTKLAFAAPATSSLYNVKVPPLLRKATSNLSTSSTTTNSGISGMGAKNSMEGLGGVVKRGGGKKSGIAYQAREDERRKKVQEGEKKREMRKFKGAEKRREVVGGLFGKGKFE